MTDDPRLQALVVGRRVLSLDQSFIGRVKEVDGPRFKVNAPFAPDYWLETARIKGMAGDSLVMDFEIGDLEDAILA